MVNLSPGLWGCRRHAAVLNISITTIIYSYGISEELHNLTFMAVTL